MNEGKYTLQKGADGFIRIYIVGDVRCLRFDGVVVKFRSIEAARAWISAGQTATSDS